MPKVDCIHAYGQYQRNAGNAFMCEYNGLASIGDYAARFTAVKNTVLYAFILT